MSGCTANQCRSVSYMIFTSAPVTSLKMMYVMCVACVEVHLYTFPVRATEYTKVSAVDPFWLPCEVVLHVIGMAFLHMSTVEACVFHHIVYMSGPASW